MADAPAPAQQMPWWVIALIAAVVLGAFYVMSRDDSARSDREDRPRSETPAKKRRGLPPKHFAKGSPEAKEHMRRLREKRKAAKSAEPAA